MASRWQNQRSKFKKQVTQDSEFLRSSLRTSLLEWLDSVSDIESWFDSLRTPALLTPEGQWQLDTFQRRILQALDLTAKTLLQHSLQKLISRFILNSQQEKPTTSSAAAQGAGGGAASSARSSNNGPAPMDLDTDDATAAVADDLRLSKRAKTESAVAAAAAASSVARASAPSAAPASASTAAVESIAVKELNDEVRQFLELELQKPECVQPAIDIKNKFTAEIRSAVGQRRITAVLLEAIAAVNRQPTSQPALASNGSNSDLAASSFPLSLWSGAASSSSAAAAAHSSSASSSAAAAPASSPFWDPLQGALSSQSVLESLMTVVEREYLTPWLKEFRQCTTSVMSGGPFELVDCHSNLFLCLRVSVLRGMWPRCVESSIRERDEGRGTCGRCVAAQCRRRGQKEIHGRV